MSIEYLSACYLSGVSRCFYCGEPLPEPFVFWHGHKGSIGLCEGCADTLAMHLLKDAAACRLADRGGPP